jgi:hypothetical protein
VSVPASRIAKLMATAGLLLAPAALPAPTKTEASNLVDHPFSTEFAPDHLLNVRIRSGDARIVAGNDHKLAVRLEGRALDRARDVRVRFESTPGSAELQITGGPKNELQIIIEVPHRTALWVRMPAGQLELNGIAGDKDVELHAGQLTIALGDAAEYRSIEASVVSGELDSPPLSESHGGLFRSFRRDGNGQYKLHAHVGAGQLTIE